MNINDVYPFFSANTFTLDLNQNVTVRVQYASPQKSIKFLLCDAKSCSNVIVDTIRSDGGLSYASGTECNKYGRLCELDFVSSSFQI